MAVPKDLAELLEAGAHFGHQTRRWNPKMAPYIFTSRDGVHVFDLTITAKLLDEACEFVSESVANGKTMIMIGTKRQAKQIVREEAAKCGVSFVAERWLGGIITNWEEMSKRIKKLIEMKGKREAGDYKRYTKKENVLINREIVRLERFFGGISTLRRIPDVLFVVDTIKEKAAIREAALRGVKVVAIVDSNSDPSVVDYPIPANDDAVRSLKYIIGRIAEAYAEGAARVAKIKPVEVKAPVQQAPQRPQVASGGNQVNRSQPVAKTQPVVKSQPQVVAKPAVKAVAGKADTKKQVTVKK